MKYFYNKSWLFTTLCFLTFNSSSAQTDQLNHDKYWYYRQRLMEYVKIADFKPDACGDWSGDINAKDEDGKLRDYEGGPVDGGLGVPSGVKELINGQWRYGFGDEGVHLGNYMAVLATEYKLLATDGQNTDQTLLELWNAMNALERMDQYAEKYYYPSSATNQRDCNLNGFCTRGIVGTAFKRKWFPDDKANIHEADFSKRNWKSRAKTRISKKGNSLIRRIMHMPALNVVKFEPIFKSFYERIYDKTGIKMKGYVAVQRKLLSMIYTLWKKNEAFNPLFISPLSVKKIESKTEQKNSNNTEQKLEQKDNQKAEKKDEILEERG